MGCHASNLSRSACDASCDVNSIDGSIEVMFKRAKKYATKHGTNISGYRPRSPHPLLISVTIEKQESSRPQLCKELNDKNKVPTFELTSIPPSNIEPTIVRKIDINILDEPEYLSLLNDDDNRDKKRTDQIYIVKENFHDSTRTKDTEMDDDDSSFLYSNDLDDKDANRHIENSIIEKNRSVHHYTIHVFR